MKLCLFYSPLNCCTTTHNNSVQNGANLFGACYSISCFFQVVAFAKCLENFRLRKSPCDISMVCHHRQWYCLGDINGVAAVSSVCLMYTLRVISWWLFWLHNFQLLQEQWWVWHASLEVIKLSAHLCRNFHNIFKGHRMLLIFVPLRFCLLRDLLSSWTLLKQVFLNPC